MSAAEDLMAKFTGGQKGGRTIKRGGVDVDVPDDYVLQDGDDDYVAAGGGRHRKSHRGHRGHKGNSWLAHVKATMKLHPGKSFKQVLKIAKKTYKRSQSQSSSQSQSQSGGKRRKSNGKGKGKGTRKGQYGGSGAKVAGVGASASPYV